MRHIFFLLGCAACAVPVAAQTLYKCNDDGKLSYSSAPCASGKGVELIVPPAPATDGAAATELAHERALSDTLDKERKAREAREAREQVRADRANGVVRRRCATLAMRKRWADEDVQHAGNRASELQQRKAKRSGEQLALECRG